MFFNSVSTMSASLLFQNLPAATMHKYDVGLFLDTYHCNQPKA